MYFPIGWPRTVEMSITSEKTTIINHICCDAVKILVAAISDDDLSIWYANPLTPIAFHKRDKSSVSLNGENKTIVWKPDSRQIAILTTKGVIIIYKVHFEPNGNGVLMQIDPPVEKLKRESAELFVKETIPCLSLHETSIFKLKSNITVLLCISLTELLIATEQCELIRILWEDFETLGNGNIITTETINNHNSNHTNVSIINLRDIPFYVTQNCYLKTLPPIGNRAYIAALEYSPFIGGCAAVFNNNRAAFLVATHLRFETQNMHGFWVPDVDDATVCSVNHKFRLLAYGRNNSDVIVFSIEDATGGLEFSHRLSISATVVPEHLGAVNELRWSPDGCVLAASWEYGGISLWSTFGALLMSSFNWDFGLHVDLLKCNPLQINRLEWSTEGYQLFLTCKPNSSDLSNSNVLQLNFVKSVLAVNPCMASQPHILLQGDDCLYLSQGNNLEKVYFGSKLSFPNNGVNSSNTHKSQNNVDMEIQKSGNTSKILSESKYWNVLQLPLQYASTNWPIRYSTIDSDGLHVAVAGRTGLAHYSMLTRKWKIFGNETQEKDFVVSGGLLYWEDFLVLGCYSLLDRTDEIRSYPKDKKLDNQFGNKIQVRAPVISLNIFQNQLIVLTADGIISLFVLKKLKGHTLNMERAYEVDVKNICIHPACIVSLTVTNLRNDLTTTTTTTTSKPTCSTPNKSSSDDESLSSTSSSSSSSTSSAETIIVNVSGRILMIQRDPRNNVISLLMASCLASCVECFWTSKDYDKSPMHDSLWLYSGANGMRVWLSILPPTTNEQVQNATHHLHTFMSKRIMLSFPLKLYPLVILFDNVIALGVENDTMLYSNETNSHFAFPFCILEQKSEVYLHKILRQLIKRNLGYSAWEIAKSCRSLPYFPHSLELLLHEVLEEEATSKEPIPDALLPSIINFIREFPVYLQTVIQCARKTEIALWPYLFSVAGKPKDLFQQCLHSEELDTAASFLIILQNLEPSLISKQYATLLLDIAIKNYKWELAKDLIRFLKAIDPNEVDSPRSSMIVNVKIAPPAQTKSQVNSNAEAFNMVLGPITRERSFSTTVLSSSSSLSHVPKERKDKPTVVTTTASNLTSPACSTTNDIVIPATSNSTISSLIRRKSERSSSIKERKEVFCIDAILQNHARTFLQNYKLIDLGYMSAFLDFHLVSWLAQEADRAAKLDDFVVALKMIHKELNLSLEFYFSEDFETYDNLKHNDKDKEKKIIYDHSSMQQSKQSQSVTSESGYFSTAKVETPISNTTHENGNSNGNGNGNSNMMMSIQEQDLYQSFPSSYAQRNDSGNWSSTQLSSCLPRTTYDNMSLGRLLSSYDYDQTAYVFGFDDSYSNCRETGGNNAKVLPEKLAIKIRYLLQLFIEANCTDYALVLSILLKDVASIGRIINGLLRAESLSVCQRINNALKHLMQWSHNKECLYFSFMITLRPYVCLLEQYVVSAQGNLMDSGGYGYITKRKSLISETDVDIDENHQTKKLGGTFNTSSTKDNNWNFDRRLSCERPDNMVVQSRSHMDENIASGPLSSNAKIKSREETGNCILM